MSEPAVIDRPAERVHDSRLETLFLIGFVLLFAWILLGDSSDIRRTKAVENPCEDANGRSLPGWPTADPRGETTSFAERLTELREAIVASDEPLLSWEELDREVVERRREVS